MHQSGSKATFKVTSKMRYSYTAGQIRASCLFSIVLTFEVSYEPRVAAFCDPSLETKSRLNQCDALLRCMPLLRGLQKVNLEIGGFVFHAEMEASDISLAMRQFATRMVEDVEDTSKPHFEVYEELLHRDDEESDTGGYDTYYTNTPASITSIIERVMTSSKCFRHEVRFVVSFAKIRPMKISKAKASDRPTLKSILRGDAFNFDHSLVLQYPNITINDAALQVDYDSIDDNRLFCSCIIPFESFLVYG
jgi:hypothetical protein